MTVFATSLFFVLIAEMGDKTQLLAMAFAMRYPAKTVLAAVFAATLVNHLLAVIAGSYLTALIPLSWVQVAAAASFILFGLWTLRGDRLEGEDRRFRFNPFWTVAVSFFFAEMGDKTQLATVALAARYPSIILIWMGTTAAMVIADAIGIGIGVTLGKRIPTRFIKWCSASIFIVFGLWGLYEYLPAGMVSPAVVAASLAVLAGTIFLALRLGGESGTERKVAEK
ncbi:MAG TPA: TMEM165/GDT1 family protein [Syntrophales bacterium]|nr:TMEM165/GDT1 family protein [Syntrophales bacterium]